MTSQPTDLEPIDPRTAQQLFLDHKAADCTDSTVQNLRYRTNHFVDWCEEVDIDNLNDLSGRDIQKFRLWRKENGDLKKITMRMHMSTLRVFIKWAASVEAVPESLYDKIMIPRVRPEDRQRDEILDAERAQEILAFLSKFQYASIEHVLLALLWETGIRIGGAKSLDVSDVDIKDNHLRLVHRPDEGTTLKNGPGGVRLVAITDELAQLLEDYVDEIRMDSPDDYGRDPLLTSQYGRLSRSTMRRKIYEITAPCYLDEPCPGCNDSPNRRCPEAVSPHSVRRGSITHFLSQDVPTEIVSDRMNVSRKVLDQHYDKRSEEVKLEQRRGYLDNV